MLYKYIRTERSDYSLTLTLARPEKRNAFTPTMVNEIAHALAAVAADDDVRLVIFKAEGPVFCAGMDLKTFQDPLLDNPNPHIVNKNISLGEVLDNFHKPTLAILEGDVIAGAFLLVLGCTYVLAAEHVRFRLPELALGIFPFQVMASLLKIMPEKKALQLCLETDYFDVQRALDYGIVDSLLSERSEEIIKARFADVQVKPLQAGIKALRALPKIAADQRFSFLKESLEKLRDDMKS
ncbi:enoyl-CoA hydratase/isomerase family protein [Sphingobacterium oryzagri]|uniref:Enoyl-CoA hydratase/isomerase family protein n=1 Tax=Sphingobacterium oryzagri TaxID=3025669 RepID=A0ABY7WJX6_9SPHI|nr:enoyl-CoA hydratase/isomerase family protein [Sphingobacterium sp. KACC 22765]WDF68771.1 enoyl-CoA hydratase/isomerase family protein [Sphingobacterium sp. KACC 22765]